MQLARFPRLAVTLGEDGSHSLAGFQADPHHRHQKLRRHLRRNLAFANLPLNRFPVTPPPAPTGATPNLRCGRTIAPTHQGRSRNAAPSTQEPTNIQRCFLFRQAQGTVENDGLSSGHRPHHCFHFVAARLLSRCDALVAVDHHFTIPLAIGRDHHDGATLCQRRQQAPLPPQDAALASAPGDGRAGETPVA
jgi:hypothetical protein